MVRSGRVACDNQLSNPTIRRRMDSIAKRCSLERLSCGTESTGYLDLYGDALDEVEDGWKPNCARRASTKAL